MRKERSSVIVCVTGQNGESIYVYIQSQVQSVDGQTVERKNVKNHAYPESS